MILELFNPSIRSTELGLCGLFIGSKFLDLLTQLVPFLGDVGARLGGRRSRILVTCCFRQSLLLFAHNLFLLR